MYNFVNGDVYTGEILNFKANGFGVMVKKSG